MIPAPLPLKPKSRSASDRAKQPRTPSSKSKIDRAAKRGKGKR